MKTDLEHRIRAVDWHAYAQPEGNTATSVADALVGILRSCDSGTSEAAYNKFLYAVGNNHAGTYCAVLLETLPFLVEIVETNDLRPQRTVLCLLDDLYASFHPEPESGDAKEVQALGQVSTLFTTRSRRSQPRQASTAG